MIINTKIQKGKLIIPKSDIERFIEKNGDCEVEIRIEKIKEKRTLAQNSALHLWFGQLAKALNDAGWDMRKTIKGGIDIPWTAMTVKEYLWRPAMKLYLNKTSTTQLDKQQDIDNIYDIINRTIAERTGVSVPFPSIENMYQEEEYGKH